MFREQQTRDTPEGKSNLAFLLFYVLGTISFLPLDFYQTANDYWMYKFRDPDVPFNSSDTAVKTVLQKDFTAYYSIVSHGTLIIFAIITMYAANKISLQTRIVGSLSTLILLILFAKIFIWVPTDSWQQAFFIFSLTLGALITGAGACLLISALELSTKFPTLYTTAILSGHALCGILAALTQILTLSMGLSSKINAMIYFAICGILILGTLVLYLVVLHNNSYIQSKLNKEQEVEHTTTRKVDFHRVKTIAGKHVIILIMLFINCSFVLVFPGITSLIESSGKGTNRWSDVFFVPVCTFLFYHLFDLIGRECSIRFNKVQNNYILFTASCCLLIFIPLILLCNVQPKNHLPVVFYSDAIFIILIILYGFTIGYVFNILVAKAARSCEPEDWYIALLILVVVFVLSLIVFSLLGSVVVNLI